MKYLSKKLFYSFIVFLLMVRCTDPSTPYGDTKWKINSYTIDGADSIKTVKAFHLQGKVSLNAPKGQSDQGLYVETNDNGNSYTHSGIWSMSKNSFGFFLRYGVMVNRPNQNFDSHVYTRKPSFKPFISVWDVENRSKKEIKLKLTFDKKKYTMQLIPF